MRIIKATAPCRICDIGGWTDTRFAEYGAVFSIAVWPGVAITIEEDLHFPRGLGLDPMYSAVLKVLSLDVLRAIVTISQDMPPGSGTGTSAATIVALIAALDKWRGGSMTPAQIAAAAHQVEAEELGFECGVQDHVASAYGGVNLIRIDLYPNTVDVKSLPIRRVLLKRLLLVDIGISHNSSDIHNLVIERIERTEDHRLVALREYAARAEHHYLIDDKEYFGDLMIYNTKVQYALHPCTTEAFDPLIKDLKEIGALGWKVNGAGAGGTITVMTEGIKNRSMIEALIETEYPEYRIIPITIAEEGVRAWEI